MARGASNVQRVMSMAHKRLIAITRELSGADSDAVKEAAQVLLRAARKQLSTAASGRRTTLKTRRTYGGTPSAPGAAPHLQSGKARRSVKSGVVDGFRRVGTGLFYLRLQELGHVSKAEPARRSRKGHTVKGVFKVFPDSRQHDIKAKRRVVIEPRPWLEPALAEATPKMNEILASIIERGVAIKLAKVT